MKKNHLGFMRLFKIQPILSGHPIVTYLGQKEAVKIIGVSIKILEKGLKH